MFSYRHAFHAGNHADVLKHVVLIAALDRLLEKDAALTVIDTHAGAGLYRLDGDYAGKSGEAAEGIHRLLATKPEGGAYAPAIERYIALLREFNPKAKAAALRVYPGSPFIAQHLLREHDKLKLFELHPTDARALAGNIGQLDAGRKITVARDDGFGSIASLLPPPSRRALLLCDPSYEIKTDYARVAALMEQALKRFATGTYVVWYPIIPRPEAHGLPRRLKTLATKASKPWLHATLTVKSTRVAASAADLNASLRGGLPGSGMFLVNPPWKLKEQLAEALPQLVAALGQDKNAGFTLEAGD
jgi:23S rRNA (adenine2030-N6)-methyltransferase